MGKYISALLFVIVSFVSALFGQQAGTNETKPAEKPALPSARSVIDKYVAAIGGKEAHLKLRSRLAKGNVELSPMGLKGTFELLQAPEAKSASRMTIAGVGEFADGSDGTTSWTVNPIQGGRERTGLELQQNLLSSNFYREVNLEKLYTKLEVTGKDSVAGRPAIILTATSEGLPADIMYFDAESGQLLRTDSTLVSPEGNQPAKIFYEDYREIDGIKMPFKVRTVLPQFEIVMTTGEVKHGVEVDATRFSRPK